MSLKNPQLHFKSYPSLCHCDILKIQEHVLQLLSDRLLCKSGFSFQNLPQKEKLSAVQNEVSVACFLFSGGVVIEEKNCLLNTLTEIFSGCVVQAIVQAIPQQEKLSP